MRHVAGVSEGDRMTDPKTLPGVFASDKVREACARLIDAYKRQMRVRGTVAIDNPPPVDYTPKKHVCANGGCFRLVKQAETPDTRYSTVVAKAGVMRAPDKAPKLPIRQPDRPVGGAIRDGRVVGIVWPVREQLSTGRRAALSVE
jgi:hypothetical protein